jgi:hypothetical protein
MALSGEYIKDGLPYKAIDILNKGIKVHPAEVKLYSRLAFIYQKLNDIFSGNYKGMTQGIPPYDLLDMWERKQNFLNKTRSQ